MNPSLDSLPDRVRRHTTDEVRWAIDAATRENVWRRATAGPRQTARRIARLDRTWDVERTLGANASTLAVAGSILGLAVNRRWFALPAAVSGFLLQHAVRGWCPPLPLLRRLKVRTRSELDQEKYALKALRGDFADDLKGRPTAERVISAVAAPPAPPSADRLRRRHASARAESPDRQLEESVRRHLSASRESLTARILALQQEWSVERHLQAAAATLGLGSALLAFLHHQRWGYVTAVGMTLLLLHTVSGADPLRLSLRRRGIRTRAQIDREIYALKCLRGDFDAVNGHETGGQRVEAALAAVGL